MKKSLHPIILLAAIMGIGENNGNDLHAQEPVKPGSVASRVIPEDVCILELTLPDGATVALNGKDYGTTRRHRFTNLTRGKWRKVALTVTYTSGKTSKHTLQIQGGKRLRLAYAPDGELPEVVPQITGGMGTSEISPDGSLLAIGSTTGVTGIYDVSTGRLLRSIQGYREQCSPKFVAGGQTLLVSYLDTFLPVLGGDGRALSVEVLYETETGRVLAEFNETADSAVISPRGDMFAFPRDAKTGQYSERPYVTVVDARSGKRLHKTKLYESHQITGIDFSRDGKTLAVCDYHHVDVYDTKTWKERRLFTYGTHDSSEEQISFHAMRVSPEGKYLYVVTEKHDSTTQNNDKTARMIAISSGRTMWTRRLEEGLGIGHANALSAFSPDGKYVVSGSDVVEVASGKPAKTYSDSSVGFVPSGRLFVDRFLPKKQLESMFAEFGDPANVDPTDWAILQATEFNFFEGIRMAVEMFARPQLSNMETDGVRKINGLVLALSRDDKMAFVLARKPLSERSSTREVFRQLADMVSNPQPLELVDLQTGVPIFRIAGYVLHHGNRAKLLPGGKHIAHLSQRRVAIVDVNLERKPLFRDGSFLGNSDDGSMVMTSSDGFVYVWKAETGEQIGRFKGYQAKASPCCRYLLTNTTPSDSKKTTYVLWNTHTGGRVCQINNADMTMDAGTRFMLNGEALYARIDNDHCIYDCNTGKQVLRIDSGPGSGNNARFSPNGKFLSWFRYMEDSGDSGGTWDYYLSDLKSKKVHKIACDGESFSSDSKWLATRESIIETATGKIALKFKHSYRAQWHPLQALLLVKQDDDDDDSHLRLFDPDTGKPRAGFQPIDYRDYNDYDSQFEFSPDGRFIIAVSGDGYKWERKSTRNSKIVDSILWDAKTGERLMVLGDVADYEFSQDGQFLYTVDGATGQVHYWDLTVGKEICRVLWTNQMQDWLVTTPEGLFDGSDGAMNKICFRIGNRLNVVPVERFFQDFYRPRLLDAVMRGERPLPGIRMGEELPPSVKIVSPSRGGETDETVVAIEATIEDEGGGVKSPWVRQNGTRVAVDSAPVREGKLLRWKFELPLIDGENKIEVQSASADGSWKSEPATITFIRSEPTEKTELYLLAIGVTEYADRSANLQYAAADAEAFAAVFRERGEKCYGEGRVHIRTLTDTSATAENIEKAIATIAEKAKPQDVFLLALSGHGAMIDQRYFFLPHEFTSKDEGGWKDDVRRHGLPGDVLQRWINKVPALKRVVVYDTCQSGGAVAVAGLSRNPFEFQRAFETFRRSTGSHIIAAATASQNAEEIHDLGHGALTYALLAGLGAVDKGPLQTQTVSTKDGFVQVRDWLSFAQDRVPTLTKLYYGREQLVDVFAEGRSFPILRIEKPKESKE